MKRILLLYIVLPIVCLASCYAFYYLNTVSPQLAKLTYAQPEAKKEHKKIIITDSKTQKKHVIIIEPPKWIDTTNVVRDEKEDKNPKKESSSKGYLPDVELLKFVIQKGREGLPVLSIGNYLPFLK